MRHECDFCGLVVHSDEAYVLHIITHQLNSIIVLLNEVKHALQSCEWCGARGVELISTDKGMLCKSCIGLE